MDDNEWDESTADQRIGSEFTYDILDELIRRGVSKTTAIMCAREVIDAAAAAKKRGERFPPCAFDLDRWIDRVERKVAG